MTLGHKKDTAEHHEQQSFKVLIITLPGSINMHNPDTIWKIKQKEYFLYTTHTFACINILCMDIYYKYFLSSSTLHFIISHKVSFDEQDKEMCGTRYKIRMFVF